MQSQLKSKLKNKPFLIQTLGLLIATISVLYPIGLAEKSVLYFTLYPGLLIHLLGLTIEVIHSKKRK